jgi:hypothetical protein
MDRPPVDVGAHIELMEMPDDPDPIPVGSRGIVLATTPLGGGEWQIAVEWSNGRKLLLLYPHDRFRVTPATAASRG